MNFRVTLNIQKTTLHLGFIIRMHIQTKLPLKWHFNRGDWSISNHIFAILHPRNFIWTIGGWSDNLTRLRLTAEGQTQFMMTIIFASKRNFQIATSQLFPISKLRLFLLKEKDLIEPLVIYQCGDYTQFTVLDTFILNTLND